MVNPNEPPERFDPSSCNNDDREVLRVIAVGSLKVVNQYIMQMYQLNYAQPYEWSKPIPTVNPNEVMCILTRYFKGLSE
ncbi:MAG: hypothetical protein ACFE0J_04465 [Elainellaceae cyanobacterium]